MGDAFIEHAYGNLNAFGANSQCQSAACHVNMNKLNFVCGSKQSFSQQHQVPVLSDSTLALPQLSLGSGLLCSTTPLSLPLQMFMDMATLLTTMRQFNGHCRMSYVICPALMPTAVCGWAIHPWKQGQLGTLTYMCMSASQGAQAL